MLINHLRTAYPDFNSNPPNIADLTGFYKEAKKRSFTPYLHLVCT
jgi:hypothetical protein